MEHYVSNRKPIEETALPVVQLQLQAGLGERQS
jgi:hypothetical protein